MLDEAVVLASDIMTRDVAAVRPEASLLDSVKLMAARGISGMPVIDQAGSVVGMITEGDLLRWHEGYGERESRWLELLAEGAELAPDFLKEIQNQHRKVKAIMSPSAISVTEDTPAREIAALMYNNHIKRVPVLRDGKLVGIVARSDLVRVLAQTLSEKPPEKPHAASVNEALRRAREEAGG